MSRVLDRKAAARLWEKVRAVAALRLSESRAASAPVALRCVKLAVPASALYTWRLVQSNPLPRLVPSSGGRLYIAYLLPGEEGEYSEAVELARGVAVRAVEVSVQRALKPFGRLTWRDLQALKLVSAGYPELLVSYPVSRLVAVAKAVEGVERGG